MADGRKGKVKEILEDLGVAGHKRAPLQAEESLDTSLPRSASLPFKGGREILDGTSLVCFGVEVKGCSMKEAGETFV